MKTHSSRLRVRGFALIEMLFCIFAMSMIVVVCGRLFHQIGRVFREVPEAMNAIQSDQQWLAQLRADAWAAAEIRVDENGGLTLRDGDTSVRWSSSSGSLRREVAGRITGWPVVETITFGLDGDLCVIGLKETSIALAQARGGLK